MSMNALQVNELNELQQGSRERFEVKDLDSANWCLRKLQALKVKAAEINTLADAEVQRIEAWRTKELESLAGDMDYFEQLLAEYHRNVLVSDPKAKTITTPYGKLKSRTVGVSAKKVDDAALLAHLKASGDTKYIVVKESPAWAEYKNTLRVHGKPGELMALDENGQVVPGVEIDLGGTTFTVEVDA